jgi:phosphoribosylcarboxyaminoimidazole (NCAIR) mutase
MAIGKAGARNAGIFAVQLLALGDSVLSEKLSAYKEELAAGVAVRAEALQERLSKEKF